MEEEQVTKTTVRSNNSAVAADSFALSKTDQVVFGIVSIINLIIFLRFIFILLGANRVGIVNFIINLSELFVAPFKGILPSPNVEGAYIEAASLVAIVMWFVLAFVVSMILRMLNPRTVE